MVNHLRPDLMEVDIKINDRIMQALIGLINAVGPK